MFNNQNCFFVKSKTQKLTCCFMQLIYYNICKLLIIQSQAISRQSNLLLPVKKLLFWFCIYVES